MKDTFGFELESPEVRPELDLDFGLRGAGPHGPLASEVGRRTRPGCPRSTRATVSGFSRYSNALSTLPATEQAKVRNLAQLIAWSFQRGCQPFGTARLVGHADNDPVREQREPGFMLRISRERGQAVRQALERLINNLAILSQLRWDVQGAAASQLVVPNPRTELERRRNRRVEIWLNPRPGCSPVDPSSPDCIRWMQSCLTQILGTQLAVNGILGVETRNALRSFQQRQGLVANGLPSPLTISALIRVCGATPPVPVLPTFGELRVRSAGGGFSVQAVTATTPGPFFASPSLDEALQTALVVTAAHTVIAGDMLRSTNFEVFRWGTLNPQPTPAVVQFNIQRDVAALVFNGSGPGFFPSDPTAATARWVAIPRLPDFYSLPAPDQTTHRNQWIAPLAGARVGFTPAQLNALSMPALRLLVAHFAPNVVPVRPFRQGGIANGVTIPILRYPISEPECYLTVISDSEGRLESINAWDAGAGISIGPIQINVQRGALFSFMWSLRNRDLDLFNQEFGPLAWSMEWDNDHPDLVINANTPQAVILHGRAAASDEQRNIGYFHTGTPGARGFNPAFRRSVAERFRNLLVWPHVQDMVIETSVAWLAPGLAEIHRAGIPPLDPHHPDRDTFILKAMLLSAFVRFSGCLSHLLRELGGWPTPMDKLANWRQALARTPPPCPNLQQRLTGQQNSAGRVHNTIHQLEQRTP